MACECLPSLLMPEMVTVEILASFEVGKTDTHNKIIVMMFSLLPPDVTLPAPLFLLPYFL